MDSDIYLSAPSPSPPPTGDGQANAGEPLEAGQGAGPGAPRIPHSRRGTRGGGRKPGRGSAADHSRHARAAGKRIEPSKGFARFWGWWEMVLYSTV